MDFLTGMNVESVWTKVTIRHDRHKRIVRELAKLRISPIADSYDAMFTKVF
jgi:hypothetical protein